MVEYVYSLLMVIGTASYKIIPLWPELCKCISKCSFTNFICLTILSFPHTYNCATEEARTLLSSLDYLSWILQYKEFAFHPSDMNLWECMIVVESGNVRLFVLIKDILVFIASLVCSTDNALSSYPERHTVHNHWYIQYIESVQHSPTLHRRSQTIVKHKCLLMVEMKDQIALD